MKFYAPEDLFVLSATTIASRKWMVCMKMSFLLITAALTGVHLVTASPGMAQNIDEVKVTIVLEGAPLKQALRQIEKQTPFRFAYVEAQIAGYDKLTIHKAERSLSATLLFVRVHSC